ncbi:polysaccharide lyase family 1 protein [Isoptericola variabilis]|uniref:Pectate lyase n=1 Tax=Isoptericola variabilis (strain 225) TaxID=743718 RepID=F6FUP0_ISOV2|nr:right-handed parallel beta-helix repeat-containing protein [Isoptericola variabilis]AEG43301.1 Pectate lyase [Isoptericola variabilis 225]TWH35236.1 pectate lyase [Isoptericola variabilis J7]
MHPTPATARRRRRAAAVAGSAAASLLLGTAVAVAAPGAPGHDADDLGRQVITPGADGWASVATTTYPEGVAREAAPVTGGAAAAPEHVYVVRTWDELRDALAGRPGGDHDDGRGNTVPRIVYVVGQIDAFEGQDCQAFADQVTVAGTGEPFSMDDYVAYYDPSGAWGRKAPSGPLEDARRAAATVQSRQTQVHVGSNVTIVGVGDDAQISGANVRIRDAHNVILRNLTISDGRDCFPEWDPGDGATGNWNSAYDNVSVWTSTSVWIDHNTFDDGEHPAESLPTVYGRPFEIHDGLLDITHGSDLVTVSYNRFEAHDKTMLVGSSDGRLQDRGQHRVTLHHNHWQDIGQRAPRVRFGDVHVYNNHYEQSEAGLFQYYWGAGRESSIVAENNAIDLAPGVDPGRVVGRYGGEMLSETGTFVDGRPTDVLAAFNASASTPLADAARWTPSDHYSYRLLPTQAVPGVVGARAGAGVLASELP